MTPQDLIKHFKTRQAIAEFFGISEVAVSKWFIEGEIPIGRQYEAQVRTSGVLYVGHKKTGTSDEPQAA